MRRWQSGQMHWTVNPTTLSLRRFESFSAHMNKKDYLLIIVLALIIFAGTYTLLTILGFTPGQLLVKDREVTTVDQNLYEDFDPNDTEILFPNHVSIPKIGVDSNIERPASQDVSVLDEALSRGAVYYPGSGTINAGNMFLFGHSTGLSVVNNQAYKTFNDLSKLEKGDEIYIESGDKKFVYKVSSLVLVDENEAFVDFSKTDRMLTISTCNTFGKKQERWVVEAQFDREI